MKLKKGFNEEYKRRHDKIWPELSNLLSESGIQTYSIFLDEKTDTLFAFQSLNKDNDIKGLANNIIVKKWWSYMADIMETNYDNSPIEGTLLEVFHME